MIASNNFEGGTDGSNITAANSGEPSGKSFTAVGLHTATLTYDSNTRNANLSNMCAKHLVTSQSIGASRYEYSSAVVVPASNIMYIRMYLKLAVHPSGTAYFVRVLNGATNVANIRFATATNAIDLMNGPNNVVEASSSALTLNTWYRFEAKITSHATAGNISARLYSSTESTTASESFATDNTVDTNGGLIDTLHFGFTGIAVTNNTMELYTDDIAVDNVDWIGPINKLDILNRNKFMNPQAVYRM